MTAAPEAEEEPIFDPVDQPEPELWWVHDEDASIYFYPDGWKEQDH